MQLKTKLPVSYLLFTFHGRISRGTYWTAAVFYWCTFYVLYNLLDLATASATFILYPILFWVIAATSVKRLHDQNKSAYWLLFILVPALGPLVLFYLLGFRKGQRSSNFYGAVPGSAPDYLLNDQGREIPHLKTGERIIDDVTRLNPVLVEKIFRPVSVEEICEIVKAAPGGISVGGGRFSMGGQTASPHTTHIDMRGMNKVLAFLPEQKSIKVEAGIRWCDIQRHIDAHNLSVKIMQTYANFTVGGALSVNAHGRYMGAGPVILSVRAIDIVLADGSVKHASPSENAEIFYGAIGGYNAIGIIVTAELELVENTAVKRVHRKMSVDDYRPYFFEHVRNDTKAIFHNADIYPPVYKKLRAVTWIETHEKPTVTARLMPLKESYPLERYFLWSFTETPFGKWRREYLIDPLLYLSKKIHWRNYEAGYDVAELEPRSRRDNTYVLLEYFVPIAQFEAFERAMADIFKGHSVNVLNVSVRHARADTGSYLAWAREEVFAFVVYYKQRTHESAKNKVAIWTRELVDAAIAAQGTYYLPYQVHATPEQFHKAYPNAEKLFALKGKLDPTYKFRNILWDTYYQPFKQKSHV